MQQFVPSAALISVTPSSADRPQLLICGTQAGIDKNTPAVVCQIHVDDKFYSTYRDFIHVYAHGWVGSLHHTATTACNIAAWGVQVSGRINSCTTTTAGLRAIRLALQLTITRVRYVRVPTISVCSFIHPAYATRSSRIHTLPGKLHCGIFFIALWAHPLKFKT